MKIPLKPGVTSAMLWTTIGVGLGTTVSGALALTTYTWAPAIISLLAVLILWARSTFGSPPPPPPSAAA